MKNLLMFLLVVLLLGCNKDDHRNATLPEATQTGRGIFACYVDGKPFIDNSGTPNGISFNCFYQLIDGQYYFGIQAEDSISDLVSIGIFSNQAAVEEGFTYPLLSNDFGNFLGSSDFSPSFNVIEPSLTNNEFTGELYITKFDIQNQIVSGTFWFDIQNPFTDERIEIREGRFDTHFGL